MTAPARITQSDMRRAVAAARAEGGEGSRVILDLAKRRIEIVLGEGAQCDDEPNPWED